MVILRLSGTSFTIYGSCTNHSLRMAISAGHDLGSQMLTGVMIRYVQVLKQFLTQSWSISKSLPSLCRLLPSCYSPPRIAFISPSFVEFFHFKLPRHTLALSTALISVVKIHQIHQLINSNHHVTLAHALGKLGHAGHASFPGLCHLSDFCCWS